MTRYFFNTTSENRQTDTEGTELADYAAAKKHGVLFAAKLMQDNPRALMSGKDIDVEITTEQGLVLFMLNIHVTNSPAVLPPS